MRDRAFSGGQEVYDSRGCRDRRRTSMPADDVAVLCEGDPFFYRLVHVSVPAPVGPLSLFEIVPGVSSSVMAGGAAIARAAGGTQRGVQRDPGAARR
ncbi:MAG: hypothetical protein ACN6I5_00965 [Hyphomicrobiales bacterium]